MRLIDADAIELPRGFFEKVDNVPKFYEWLDKQPTIEAEPKHGRWIWQGHYLVCSECGRENDRTNYCPNCGAKMDEVEE